MSTQIIKAAMIPSDGGSRADSLGALAKILERDKSAFVTEKMEALQASNPDTVIGYILDARRQFHAGELTAGQASAVVPGEWDECWSVTQGTALDRAAWMWARNSGL